MRSRFVIRKRGLYRALVSGVNMDTWVREPAAAMCWGSYEAAERYHITYRLGVDALIEPLAA